MAAHEASTVEPGAPSPRPGPFHQLLPEPVYLLPSWPPRSVLRGMPLLCRSLRCQGSQGLSSVFSQPCVLSWGVVSRFSVLLVRISLLKP